MRNTFNRKAKIGLVAGILLCVVLVVSALSMTTTFAFAQDSSVLSSKLSYGTPTYLDYIGFGGIRYITYN